MARVETGHIHLGSSILHHREGWETKSLKKTAGTHRNTRTVISTPACMHAHKHTNKNSVARPVSYKKKNTASYCKLHRRSLQYENLKNRKHTQTHDPLSSWNWWNMNWSITAWNGSLPRTVLVLCHIVFYCQKKRKGRKKRERNS